MFDKTFKATVGLTTGISTKKAISKSKGLLEEKFDTSPILETYSLRGLEASPPSHILFAWNATTDGKPTVLATGLAAVA